MIERAEKQYLGGLRRIYETGTDLPNHRTGSICRTVINIDLVYDASSNRAPITTTRKPSPRLAIAELLGYIKGVTSAEQMRELGAKSWDANANENAAWLANPNRKFADDIGLIYGAVAKQWPVINPPPGGPKSLDLFRSVYNNLRDGQDGRGEIISFWNPGMFHLGCLRPCMYEHQFSLIGDDLYLNSTQRSSDWALGTDANKLQVWVLLRLMAQITGKNPKLAFHRNVNCHIYGNQLPLVPLQLEREIYDEPTLDINPEIKTLDDVERWVSVDDFKISIPQTHPPIHYPFSV